MKRTVARLIGVAVVLSLSALVAGWSSKRQQVVPQPCPFDPDLSVGVAFQGPHRYFETGEVQEKTINARIAWFKPVEQPNPDAFDDRVSQEPPEDDWDWWTTLYPTTLIVQVTDAKKRLRSAEVWNFDFNLLDGVIEATPDGSSIIGTLTLENYAKFRQVIVKDKADQPLAKLLVKNPETFLRLVQEYARWFPHPPKRDVEVEETVSPCNISPEGHPVEVYDETKKEVVTKYYTCNKIQYRIKGGCPPDDLELERHYILRFGIYLSPHPGGCSILHTRSSGCETWVYVHGPAYPVGFEPRPLIMTKRFYNPHPYVIPVEPPEPYKRRYVLEKMELPSYGDVDPADHRILDELHALQKSEEKPEYQTSVTAPYDAPPYSEGCIKWALRADTNIYAIYAYPVRKIKEKGWGWFDEFVVSALRIVASGIFGAKHPKKNLLAQALMDAWIKDVSQRKEVKEVLQVGDLRFFGDIWVLDLMPLYVREVNGKLEPDPRPREMWIRNLTQDVKVQITVNGTPMYGSVTIERVKAITNPAPPMMPLPPDRVDVPPEGKTIALGKGWKWKLTAFAAGGSASEEIAVPPTTSVTIKVPAPQSPPGGQPPGGQPPGGQPPGGQPPNGSQSEG